MKKIFIFAALLVAMVACSGNSTKSSTKADTTQVNDTDSITVTDSIDSLK